MTITSQLGLGYFTDPNQLVHVISYIGEGAYEICEGQKTRVVSSTDPFSEGFTSVMHPRSETWAKVTLKNKSTGWVLVDALKSTEGDNCEFDPPLH